MRTILLLMALLAAVIFAVQNASTVTVDLLAWRIEASLAVAIAACFAAGVAAGSLFWMSKLYRACADRRRLRAQLRGLGADDALASKAPVPSGGAAASGAKFAVIGNRGAPTTSGVDCYV